MSSLAKKSRGTNKKGAGFNFYETPFSGPFGGASKNYGDAHRFRETAPVLYFKMFTRVFVVSAVKLGYQSNAD